MNRIARNINPFTDFGFKKLFGEQVSKDLLLDFINAVLEGETDPIVELEFSKRNSRNWKPNSTSGCMY